MPPPTTASFRLALRDVAAFCWRSGGLFRDDATGADAQEGIAGHQRLRARRPNGYRSEVAVRLEQAGDGWELVAGGRMDGLYEDDGLVVVEEIKTLHGDPARLPSSLRDLHRAQARLYAALHAQARDLAAVGVEVTWYDLDADHETRERLVEERAPLDIFLAATRGTLARWLDAIVAHRRARDASIAALAFPHAQYRPGQRALVAAAWRTMRDGGTLLAEAPTGTGKTVSLLFPALKGFTGGFHDRVGWLTATQEGRLMPERVLASLADDGLRLFALSLAARESTCPCAALRAGESTRDATTPATDCPLATHFYDHLDDARHTALAAGVLDRAGLRALGERTGTCPWALGRELAPWADLLVLDLNHAFDPGSRLAFLLDDSPARTTMLIDEAHQLSSRVRGMHSERLDLDALRGIARRHRGTSLATAAGRLARQGARLQKLAGPDAVGDVLPRAVDAMLVEALDAFIEAAGRPLAIAGDNRPADVATTTLTDLFFRAYHGRVIAGHWSERFVLFVDAKGTPRALEFCCLDAAPLLAPAWPTLRSALLFSGTLRPLPATARQAGLPEQAVQLALPSPFPPENLAVFTCPHIDTRLAAREASLPAIAQLVLALVNARRGRYLIAFPSYRYLEDALTLMREQLPPECVVVTQARGMDAAARAAFLAPFRDDATPWVAGFAIAGGLFAEGVDFPGEALVGVMVVGTALPAISAERELMRERLADDLREGWRHAYELPGLARVLQTAGRLIRSETDRGVLVLADRRYGWPDLLAELPAWWRPCRVRDAGELGRALQVFWTPGADGG